MGNRITRSAKMRTCTLRLPDCKGQGTVLAHAPSNGKGMGFKSPDWWAAYACQHCHDVVDGRVSHPYISQALINERWLGGIFETQETLFAEGLLTVT